MQFLSQAAHHAPSADNAQPWQLTWQDNSLTVSYSTERVGTKTFPADSHAILLTMGALSENLTQAAAASNVSVAWHWPTNINLAKPVYFDAKITHTDNTNVPEKDNVALFNRHTNRHQYQNKDIPAELTSLLKNLTQGTARILVFEDKSIIQEIAKAVRSASEIRFQTQEVHEWLANSLRFTTNKADLYGEGLDVATIDLPPGGKVFLRLICNWKVMNWLNICGAYKVLALIDSLALRKAPALIAIVGSYQFRDTLAAGQLMNRAWITLNEQGIAVHPYYVLSDQLQRRQLNTVPEHLTEKANLLIHQTKKLFQLQNDETLHMIFRVGYPIKSPVKSKRLPLETVCSSLDLERN